ncbi:hypothetical protein V5799_034048 [Amblyomma americanum]|uniref:Uncharacterized protein n=1 Tax=Amblyomma americanum TaxID=6943 RepID=A0AAQ4DLK4_AMBAM
MAAEEPLPSEAPAFLAIVGAHAFVELDDTAVNDVALKLASAAVTGLDARGSPGLDSSRRPAGVKDCCWIQRSSISCPGEPCHAPTDSGRRGSDGGWTGASGGTA